MPAGYSGTPLVRKLGLKPGMTCAVLDPPPGYDDLLADPPEGLTWTDGAADGLDFVHLFARESDGLRERMAVLRGRIARDGMIWVSWPKKRPGVPTAIDENRVRAEGLAAGLVDVKVCAVDDTWSGLKFVIRKADRARILVPAAFLLSALGAGCGGGTVPPSPGEREILPDGRVLVTYREHPAVAEDTVREVVRIGSLEGGGPESFGSVRALEVDAEGTIYVLDQQASEVRAFGADGRYLRTVATRGQGPGEITSANGILLGPDGVLWVNDHGARVVMGLTPEGVEVARHPPVVPGFGFTWQAGVDGEGVFREVWSSPVGGARMEMPTTGPTESEIGEYLRSYDPRTQGYDSVALGVDRRRAYAIVIPQGFIGTQIPFDPVPLVAVASDGGAWVANSGTYRIARIDASGDTLLVLRVEVAPDPVTDADRAAWRSGPGARFQEFPRELAGIEALMPRFKPLLTRLLSDDAGRIWVGRTVPDGAAPLFDVFDGEGRFLASLRLFDGLSPFMGPRVRAGRVHALVLGEFDEHYVAVGVLPAALGGG